MSQTTSPEILKAALLGLDLTYTVSPELHKLLFPLLNAQAQTSYTGITYDKMEVSDAASFSEWVKNAPENGYAGANVTNPYKTDAYQLATNVFAEAADIRSGNTFRFFGDHTTLASTDGKGFMCSLSREISHFDLSHYHFIAIGAGGTAKSLLYSILTHWMPLSFTLIARDVGKANELMQFIGANQPGPSLEVASIVDFEKRTRPEEACVILNTTPVGHGKDLDNILPNFQWSEDDIAIDVVYSPCDTQFLLKAQEEGARTINGLGMLIEQGALSQYYWLTSQILNDSPLTLEDYFSIKEKLSAIIQQRSV